MELDTKTYVLHRQSMRSTSFQGQQENSYGKGIKIIAQLERHETQ